MITDRIGWPAVLALVAAILVLLLGLGEDLMAVAYWQVSVFGLVMVGIALWKRRQWWLLLLVPIFGVPLYIGAALLYSCSQGTCL